MPKREYVLTNGIKFIKQDADGKYKQTTSIGLADSWDSGKVAESVLVNSIPKILGGKFYVAYLDETGELVKYTLSPDEKRVRKIEVTSNQEGKSFELCQYSFDADEEVQKIILGFEDVRDVLKSNLDKFRILEKKLCRLDYIGEDLTHCKGRKTFNARDGYKLNSAAQKLFLKRVSVKNQMEIVKSINIHYNNIMSHIEDICNTIDDVRHRTYKPRVLVKLFEDGDVDLDYILNEIEAEVV